MRRADDMAMAPAGADGRGAGALRVIVLDVDGAVMRQKRLLAAYRPLVVPLRDRSEALRYWCRVEELESLRRLLRSMIGSAAGSVIFYGSGDYHHPAWLPMSLIAEPITVIHLDNRCLLESENFAAYPGRQGTMTLAELLAAISLISKRKRITAADVCGDPSPAAGALKRLTARVNERDIPPADFSSPDKIRLNETVNLKILERLIFNNPV